MDLVGDLPRPERLPVVLPEGVRRRDPPPRGAVRRAPGDPREARVRGAPELRARRVLPEAVELPHPLLHHPAPLLDGSREAREDVGDQLAGLRVLVRPRLEDEALRPRERARAPAARRARVPPEALRGA